MLSADGHVEVISPEPSGGRNGAQSSTPSAGRAASRASRLWLFRGSHRLQNTKRAANGTLLGNAPGFILPFVIAHEFGATRIADAYFLSVSSVLFCTTLFSLALETSIVPFAIEWHAEGMKVFAARLKLVIWQGSIGIVCAYVVVSLAVVQLLGLTSFNSGQKHMVGQLLILLSPLPVLVTVTSALSGALNGCQSFFGPAATQGLRSSVALAIALIVGRRPDALYLVAIGLSVGEGARLVLLAARLRMLLYAEAPRPDLATPKSTDRPSVWRIVAPQVFSMMLVGLNPIADKTVAATLPIGSVTLIELAERLYLLPRVLASSAIGVVSASTWAGHHVQGDREGLERDYKTTQRATWVAGTVAAVVLAVVTVAAAPLVRPILHVTDRTLFVELTLIFLAGLPAALSADLGTRLLTATRETRVLPLFAVLNFSVNLGADVVGAWLWGPIGIAVSSTLMRFGASGMYGIYIHRRLRPETS